MDHRMVPATEKRPYEVPAHTEQEKLDPPKRLVLGEGAMPCSVPRSSSTQLKRLLFSSSLCGSTAWLSNSVSFICLQWIPLRRCWSPSWSTSPAWMGMQERPTWGESCMKMVWPSHCKVTLLSSRRCITAFVQQRSPVWLRGESVVRMITRIKELHSNECCNYKYLRQGTASAHSQPMLWIFDFS